MICPHCHKTIREEKRYMMSRDPLKDGMVWTPLQRKAALYLLLFVIAVGFFIIIR